MSYYIYIKDLDDQIIKTLGPYDTERQADKADMGLNRQIDHDNFYTIIIDTDYSEVDKESEGC